MTERKLKEQLIVLLNIERKPFRTYVLFGWIRLLFFFVGSVSTTLVMGPSLKHPDPCSKYKRIRIRNPGNFRTAHCLHPLKSCSNRINTWFYSRYDCCTPPAWTTGSKLCSVNFCNLQCIEIIVILVFIMHRWCLLYRLSTSTVSQWSLFLSSIVDFPEP